MKIWIIFILLYGIFKGTREPVKKAVLRDMTTMSALVGYTVIGFLMSVPTAKGVFDVTPKIFIWVILKSFAVFVAWILGFKGLKRVPVSLYGLFDMSRVIFSTFLGVVFLYERLTVKGFFSIILVIVGLCFAEQRKTELKEDYNRKYIWYILLGCFFNAVSGTLDKYIMSTGEITSSALQFWFMLMLSLFYLAYAVIKKEKLEIKKAFTNPFVYLLSFSLVFGDRLLFIANQDPESKVTIMTVLKQCSAIVTIVLGKILYKEKNIARKLICALIIIMGIVLSII